VYVSFQMSGNNIVIYTKCGYVSLSLELLLSSHPLQWTWNWPSASALSYKISEICIKTVISPLLTRPLGCQGCQKTKTNNFAKLHRLEEIEKKDSVDNGLIFLYVYGVILLSFQLRLKLSNISYHNKKSRIEISVYIQVYIQV